MIDSKDETTFVEKDFKHSQCKNINENAMIFGSAEWFSMEKVHYIEQIAFPDIFLDKKECGEREEEYIRIRNHMVESFYSRPYVYYSLATLRRSFCCDFCLALRIHRFLEKWKIINVQQKTNQSFAGKDKFMAEEQGKNESKESSLLDKYYHFSCFDQSILFLKNTLNGLPRPILKDIFKSCMEKYNLMSDPSCFPVLSSTSTERIQQQFCSLPCVEHTSCSSRDMAVLPMTKTEPMKSEITTTTLEISDKPKEAQSKNDSSKNKFENSQSAIFLSVAKDISNAFIGEIQLLAETIEELDTRNKLLLDSIKSEFAIGSEKVMIHEDP
ncbi:putative SWI/SNF related-matrix-associated actin-dependent regulator of chromatin subfamily C [Monocercomonoides exilis]|uniref:putative SWI/SNF related-matrix-associated actin-dependent regulator of chromatin subfamily C n=1 Tax=Monocercomonoides exilis TaxID=2049356 RepID=UPI003559D73B|nr:putative SWI/SNF related-matrix-associated actin-dependent regulator of chromatin subfamily C [Monocercomonoides exilis]|eukprot:MONOS_654.1-p1 / transcript=MONOS_654.1 / gene=MONOS_654 / organism=Monocercomonoides_exilis_PA203 / gene_product=unspecified product / transcript_product=unspecified product / location=Mono_scaffold00011:32512-33782(+) / protein_length=326 / sequence_SO=supercontig / SO=protein_coding / is_pseudo=false